MRKLSLLNYASILISCCFFGGCTSSNRSTEEGRVPRTLVIGLDGISYETFRKFQRGGHFRQFQQVSPMVATFPSTSDPNWSRLMGLPPEEGFTKAFFDPRIPTGTGLGTERGSLASHLIIQPRYEQLMDFTIEGLWEHLSTFIWTRTTALYWLESLEKKFFEFRGRDIFFAFILNTDILSHTEGELSVIKFLKEIEDHIVRIQQRYFELYDRKLEVVLVSDHGNGFYKPIDVPFEYELKEMGWTMASTISSPRDVGFFVPEILSFGVFYTQPSSIHDLALSLSKVAHVHSSMYAVEPYEVRVLGQGGTSESQIRYSETKDLLHYKVLKGQDPLHQIHHFKNGPLKTEAYFKVSLSDPLPNAVFRIWEGFFKNSEIRPHVLVNPDYGYVFGNKALRLLTDIKGFASAHGSLHHQDTCGIVASTEQVIPAIRPQDFGKWVDLKGFGKRHLHDAVK